MEIRILGAHQWESIETKCTALLVDGVLAIDAGSLTSTLHLDEQRRISTLLLTHQHLDHVKDVGSFGFNTLDTGPKTVVCPPWVRQVLQQHILNGVVWLDLTTFPSPARPALCFREIEAGQALTVGNYRIEAILMRHSVPSVAYHVTAVDGKSFLFTSDTGRGWAETVKHLQADLIITEVTWANGNEGLADIAFHLTPSLLEQELLHLRAERGIIPPVVVIHINPPFEAAIRDQLAEIARKHQFDIDVGYEGMRIAL